MINFVVVSFEDALLSSETGSIPESTMEYMQAILDKGMNIAVVTGRTYEAVYPMMDNVKDSVYYICNDGGVIIYKDEVLISNTVDRTTRFSVENTFLEDKNFKFILQGERKSFTTDRSPSFLALLKERGEVPEIVEDIKDVHDDISKIAIFAKEELDEKAYSEYYLKWSERAFVSITNLNELYVTAQYVSKGNAVKFLQEKLETTFEDTVVFGGNFTDITMFECGYYSYAMQSADAQVKREARHITMDLDTIFEDLLRVY